jgi:hypothetical protein
MHTVTSDVRLTRAALCVQGAFDLVCIGIGLMLGAGVFVTTGDVAVNNAG